MLSLTNWRRCKAAGSQSYGCKVTARTGVFTMELVHNGRPWLLSIITDMWFTVLPQRVVVCRESTTVKMDYTGKKGSGGVRGVGWIRFGIVSFFGVLFKQFAQGQHPITTSVLYFGGICLLPKYSTVLHNIEPCQKQPFICKKKPHSTIIFE